MTRSVCVVTLIEHVGAVAATPPQLGPVSGLAAKGQRIQQTIDSLLDEAAVAISRSAWTAVHDRSLNVLAHDTDNSDAHAFMAAAEICKKPIWS